jgi:predicted Zn-dependent protease
MGLAGVRLLAGDAKGALELIARAEKNRASQQTLAAWRCEAYRRLGDAKRAVEEFRKAGAVMPFRPSLWINGALALHDAGETAEAARIAKELSSRFEGLFAEARKAARASAPRAVLEAALKLMRGNRSSWFYLYHDLAGRPRLAAITLRPGDKVPEGLVNNRWMFRDPRAERERAAWERLLGV